MHQTFFPDWCVAPGLWDQTSAVSQGLTTFATASPFATLVGWYRAGVDVEANLALLSTFLGHVDPAATYWYLQAVPELLGIVSQRLEAVLGELP